ncbi:MAG: YjjG family noncanonical pyrimidine nucleotidase [Fermentimonas sp.]
MSQKYRSVFIDLDDTLWDIAQNGKKCLEGIYRDYGFDKYYPSFEEYYGVYMPSNNHLWGLYRDGKIKKDELIVERFLYPLREFGVTDPEYAIKISDDFLERTTHETLLVDGALDLLDYLSPKYKLYILSNGFNEVQHKKIENSGLKHYFDKVFLSEQAEINKPHPDFFTYALKNSNSARGKTVMIGDNWEADIVGAYMSKIDQIWFNPEGLEPKEFEPTFTVRKLAQIKDIL